MIRRIYYITITLLLIVWYTLGVPKTMEKPPMLLLIFLAFLSLLIYGSQREANFRLKFNFFKPTYLALLGICIVFFQADIDYLLGNIPKNFDFLWINENVVLKGLIISVIGLNSFLFGASLYKSKIDIKHRDNILFFENKKTNLLQWFAFFSLMVFFATVNPLYLYGAYGSEQMGTVATYSILFFTILVVATIVQNCINLFVENIEVDSFWKYINHQGILFSLLILIYLLGVLLSGDRGPLITLTITYVTGYFFITKRKLKVIVGISLLVASVFFISLLGIVRMEGSSMSFGEKVENSLNAPKSGYMGLKSFSPGTLELASSVRTLNLALSYIPQKHDFFYGRFQFQYIVASIPFVSIFFPLIFRDNSVKYAGSASFVTWIRQGDFPSSGDGTSVIGDFYCDFGILGVILGMYLFGLLMGFMDKQLYSEGQTSLFMLVFMFIYIPSAIYISRSAFLFSLKSVVWVYLIIIINQILQKKYIIKKNR